MLVYVCVFDGQCGVCVCACVRDGQCECMYFYNLLNTPTSVYVTHREQLKQKSGILSNYIYF